MTSARRDSGDLVPACATDTHIQQHVPPRTTAGSAAVQWLIWLFSASQAMYSHLKHTEILSPGSPVHHPPASSPTREHPTTPPRPASPSLDESLATPPAMIALFNNLRGQQHTATSPGVWRGCAQPYVDVHDKTTRICTAQPSQIQSLHSHMKLKSPKRRQQRAATTATKQLETMALSQRLSTTSLTTGAGGAGAENGHT